MSFPRKRQSSTAYLASTEASWIPAFAGMTLCAGEACILRERSYAVYIMASRRNGTLHTGVTNNLALRAHQHRSGVGSVFTAKYGIKLLVWYEFHTDINEAIAREKQLKKWERKWKLKLIEDINPEWADLYMRLNQ